MDVINNILTEINKANTIAVAGHISPDGDAIGACFAMALMLNDMGKKPYILLEEFNPKFNMLPGCDFVYKGDYSALKPDLFISIDSATPERLGEALKVMERTAVTVCIDHHISTQTNATFKYLDENASSSSQLVFKIINQNIAIDKDIATALYTGIVFDTGGFRHSSTTQETMEIVGKLISLNIPFSRVYNEVMLKKSFTEAKILAKALETLEIDSQAPFSKMFITSVDMQAVGANKNDLDGIVEQGLNIHGSKASVFIYQTAENEVKISLRSSSANICEVAQKFGGGGHKLAAGCNFSGSIGEAFEAVLPHLRKAILDNE